VVVSWIEEGRFSKVRSRKTDHGRRPDVKGFVVSLKKLDTNWDIVALLLMKFFEFYSKIRGVSFD
jgi:catalase